MYYNKFVSGNPTGDDRPWPTRVYTVKPGLTAAPDDSDLDDSSPTFTDYVYIETEEEHKVTSNYMTRHKMWSRPEHGPWSVQAYNEELQRINTSTYRNGSTTYRLSQVLRTYWKSADVKNGKPNSVEHFSVTGGSPTHDSPMSYVA